MTAGYGRDANGASLGARIVAYKGQRMAVVKISGGIGLPSGLQAPCTTAVKGRGYHSKVLAFRLKLCFGPRLAWRPYLLPAFKRKSNTWPWTGRRKGFYWALLRSPY